MDALISGRFWHKVTQMPQNPDLFSIPAKRNPRCRGSLRLRGRDSNPNFLIQSQASYR
jgi:hypothetical protein